MILPAGVETDVFGWVVPPGLSEAERQLFQFEVVKKILLAVERVISKLKLVCTPEDCPRMIASEEWHFLCAPHPEKPRDCAAIDYMKHTVDSTTSTLLLVGKNSFGKQFPSIVRRLYRIYGHIYFHHNGVFEEEFSSAAKFFHFLKKSGMFKQDMMIIPESVFSLNKFGGTIVDLRTVAIQLSQEENEEEENDATSVDTTVM